MGLRREWYVRDGLTDYLVVLRFDVERAEQERAVERWLAARMALGWLQHPRNRGLMLELFDCVRLHPFGGDGVSGYDFERAAEQALAQAFEHGDAVLVRLRERAHIRTAGYLDEEVEHALGPDSRPTPQDATVWIGIKLVDQHGAPAPGRPYRVVTPDGETIDGQLDSNGAAMIKTLKTPGTCKVSCPYVSDHPDLTHTVKPGEHISGIAQAYGFDDYKDVWNHSENADLQNQRPDPHVLQPGDLVYVPEAKDQPAAKPTGAQHTFTVKRSPLKLRLRLLDLRAKAISRAQVTVAGSALTTDGAGVLEAAVDKTVKDAPLDVPSSPEVDLAVGDLNASDDTSDAGYKARLYNLGFLWNPTIDDADDEMLIALQDFQAQYQLPVTGQLDEVTKAQLLQVYGC
jgi:hypothetical protein